MRLAKWGDGLAIRLPASVVKALDLKLGNSIEIRITSKHTFIVVKTPGPQERLKTLRKYRGRLPEGFKFNRLEANQRIPEESPFRD